jgi:DNA-binding response OmpR family regulator
MDILFVEDLEESCFLIPKLQTSGGHRVVPAGSVGEAMQLLSCLRFDALVSDIALPDGSGLELVAEAKKRQRFMKAVALTAGLGQPEDRDWGLRAGFDEYLAKPIDLYQLCAVLD